MAWNPAVPERRSKVTDRRSREEIARVENVRITTYEGTVKCGGPALRASGDAVMDCGASVLDLRLGGTKNVGAVLDSGANDADGKLARPYTSFEEFLD